MSLKTMVDGVGQTIADTMTGDQPDTATLRAPVLASLDTAERQWAGLETDDRPRWFDEDNSHVAFSPTLASGAPLTIDGQTRVFIPADRFADYLHAMRAAVHAGVFDDEIRGAAGNSPNVSGLATVAMPEPRTGSHDEIRQAQMDEVRRRHATVDDRAGNRDALS